MKEQIRVLVVDDHLILREGILTILQAEPSIEIIGEASNGSQAIEMAKELMPDVILMDLCMPQIGGIAATRMIYKDNPHIRVVILTVSDSSHDLVEAIKAGAVGYLIKDTAKEKLVEAVKAAYKREAVISSSIAIDLLDEFKKLVEQKRETAGKTGVLSQRETEILRLMAQGLDNKAISKKIFASESTVKNHVSNILTKLQLENRVQAGVLAAKENLI